MQIRSIAFIASVLVSAIAPLQAQTLSGSRSSMQNQYQQAVRYGYSFLQTPTSVNNFVQNGYLVKVTGDRMTELHDVSYPYARPEVKMFIERLSGQYFSACGEKLTVTSLTRPLNKQPANAAEDSVHPTGMAVDLRIPGDRKCRSWLESTLLSLEGTGVLDVTRERRPPHYHVAVFTKTYESYVASLSTDTNEYLVMKGDTLSSIATLTGTSILALRNSNALRNDLIQVGQKLAIPREASMEPLTSPTASTAPTVIAQEVVQTSREIAETPVVNANTVSAVNTTTTAAPLNYTVRRGDSLTLIASRMGTSIEDLRRVNGLRKDTIIAGETLLIPVLPQSYALGSAPSDHTTHVLAVEHKVRRGESLWRIAKQYGTSILTLRRDNALSNDDLKPGQVLRVSLSLN